MRYIGHCAKIPPFMLVNNSSVLSFESLNQLNKREKHITTLLYYFFLALFRLFRQCYYYRVLYFIVICGFVSFMTILKTTYLKQCSSQRKTDGNGQEKTERDGRNVYALAMFLFCCFVIFVLKRERDEEEKKTRSVEFWQECRKLDLVTFQSGSRPKTLGSPSLAARVCVGSWPSLYETRVNCILQHNPTIQRCMRVHKEEHVW